MTAPKEAIISLTNKCNLKCEMCDIPKGVKDEISTKILKELIQDLKKINCKSIVFSGGEPFVRKDVFELINHSKNNNLKVCITSNGTLINDEIAQRLAKEGIGVINISLDGRKKTHDLLRGEGNYDKAIKALEALKTHHIETTIATVVCKQNYKELPFIIRLARKLGATTVKFQPFNLDFLNDKTRIGQFYITKKECLELDRIIKETVALARKHNININPETYINKMGLMLQNNIKPQTNKGCNALYDTISIVNNSDVIPCFPITDKPIGNINKKRFLEIWNSKEHKKIRENIKKEGCPGCLMSCYDNNFETKVGSLKTKFERLKNAISKFY
ncbi:MAG: radical SAM protein [Nanoarchaeota archaeon]|nr:radical SAM protein [Nanoarchaeota archaeon]MBU1269033.1 radical SAM protein [Nanoarchaeota archaeon]MBU1604065.1 radical SAM protein [Nanoarchaeota archaeon]MBU2442733.1 radical SAM protein [Nanoarchaeota archaeon]